MEDMVKKFLKGFLYFVVIAAMIGVAIGVFVGSFPVFATAARGFMIAVTDHQYEKAYTMLSPDFQHRQDLPTFIANVQSTGLDQFEKGEFNTDVIAPDKSGGTVTATITTKNNRVMRVVFYFTQIQGKEKHEKEWRIDNIKFPDEQK